MPGDHPGTSELIAFASVLPSSGDTSAAVAAAEQCLDRFTHAFNTCDTVGMDEELAFPHWMLSGAERLEWRRPGQHPADFFATLKASGWASTGYWSKTAVLASQTKVHFVLRYARYDARGETISVHENLWIVAQRDGAWKLVLRSY